MAQLLSVDIDQCYMICGLRITTGCTIYSTRHYDIRLLEDSHLPRELSNMIWIRYGCMFSSTAPMFKIFCDSLAYNNRNKYELLNNIRYQRFV